MKKVWSITLAFAFLLCGALCVGSAEIGGECALLRAALARILPLQAAKAQQVDALPNPANWMEGPVTTKTFAEKDSYVTHVWYGTLTDAAQTQVHDGFQEACEMRGYALVSESVDDKGCHMRYYEKDGTLFALYATGQSVQLMAPESIQIEPLDDISKRLAIFEGFKKGDGSVEEKAGSEANDKAGDTAGDTADDKTAVFGRIKMTDDEVKNRNELFASQKVEEITPASSSTPAPSATPQPEATPETTLNCKYCNDTKICQECGGMPVACDHCGGKGYRNCFVCDGSGNCSSCHGMGWFPVFDRKKGTSRRDCGICHGSGNCKYCDGEGQMPCKWCDGSGQRECIECGGKGTCLFCR